MLNELEKVTIQAFITALAKLDSPLPADLQKQINQVGDILSTQPTIAANKLIELAENPCLNQLYQQARVNIQSEYESQERNMQRNLNQEINENNDDEYPKFIIDNRTKSVRPEISEILQADDSRKKAKDYVIEFQLKIRRVFS